MKAVQIQKYGGTDTLEVTDIDEPGLEDSQVLIEVHAASLNPFDTALREGRMKDAIPLSFPAVLGGDLAGVVLERGKDVTGLEIGDKVYGQASVAGGNSGAFAEYAATAAAQVAKMPANVGYEEAASLPLVGVSALQALTEHIKLQPGQKIFIHGGTGGIGTAAIQIAKHLGAYVAASSKGPPESYLIGLGADLAINTGNEDFAELLSDYDAVFDTVGRDDFTRALSVLKRGGAAVSMTAPADSVKAEELGVTALTQGTKVNSQKLNELRELVEKSVVKPQIHKIFPLEQVRQAFEARESGAVRGKIVLKIRS